MKPIAIRGAVAFALLNASLVASQESAAALNTYIGLVQSAAGVINSAKSAEAATRTTSTSSSSAPSTPAAATTAPAPTPTSAPPASHGSNRKTTIIAVVCAIVGAILIGLILLGLLCCLARRRKRRSRGMRTPSPIRDREAKPWKSVQPENPGRSYAPLASQGQVPSMTQEPTVPLTAHHGASNLDQHPAHRPQNPFVPVPPSPRRPHHQNSSSFGTDATLAPYAAMSTDPEKQPLAPHSRDNSPYRPGTGSSSTHRPSTGSSGLPTHAGPDRPSTPFGLMDSSGALGAGAAGAAGAAAGAAAAKNHQHHNEPVAVHRRSQEAVNPAFVGNQSNNAPLSQATRPAGYTGPSGLNQNRTSQEQQPYLSPRVRGAEMRQNTPQNAVESNGINVGGDPRGSGGPYTSIGQPYDDMHVHVLQTSEPSRTLQHSPPHVAPINSNAAMSPTSTSLPAPYSNPYAPPPPIGASIPRYSTPPQVPSRSPRRSNMQNHNSNSSIEGENYDSTTASSSENGWQPSYAPAVSTEHSSSPHSSMQHHTPKGSNGSGANFSRNSNGHNVHFRNSPTTASTPVGPPPPVPWDTTEARRYSPQGSPRGSATYERRSGQYERSGRDSFSNNGYGKRTSHSPATSINGQPRRLRFSDLQPTEQPRDWENQRFTGGVGEAL